MPRIDVLNTLLSKGGFLDDYPYKGRYGVFVRSPYPHARILGIDVDKAVNEGALVLTGKDFMARTMGSTERERDLRRCLLPWIRCVTRESPWHW